MTTRVDVLQIRLESTGDGKVKASLAEVSAGVERVERATERAAAATRKHDADIDRQVAALKRQADTYGMSERALIQYNRAQLLASATSDTQRALINQNTDALLRKVDATEKSAQAEQRWANAGAALGAILSVTAVAAFNTVREFERLRSVMTTLEGSQAAAAVQMRVLRDLAAETPFSVGQMVEAYAALKARGLDPSREALIAYGNVASGTGRTIQQFIEAVGDAATGEFERLKEFGIIAKSAGDQVQFTFQGVTTSVGKNAEEIEAYLQKIGNVNFAGAMSNEMDTINGAISNLIDNVQALFIAMGDSGLTGVLTLVIQAISEGVQVLTSWLDRSEEGSKKTGALAQVMGVAAVAFTYTLEAVKLLGAGFGALVEYALSAYDAIKALAGGAIAFLDGIEQAKMGNLAGAWEAIKRGADDAAAGYESAVERSNRAFATLRDMVVEAFGENIQKKIDTVLKVFGSGAENAGKKAEGAAGGVRTLTGEQQKQIDATEKQIAALQRQVDTFGMSQEALIEYNRAQQLASAVTQEQRDRINALTDALVRKMRAQAELERSTEQFVRTMQSLATVSADFQRLNEQLARQFEGPSTAAAREYASALATIAEYERQLLQLGPMTADQAQQIAAARQNAARAYEQAQREAVVAAERAAVAQMTAAERVLLQGAQDLSTALADGLLSGDWDDVGRRLGQSILGGMLETWAQANISGPLQQFMTGNTGAGGQLSTWGRAASFFTGRGFETESDFVGPPAALSNNGGGTANWGAQAGQAVQGAAVGYAIGGELFGGSQENQNLAAVGAAIGTYIMPGIGTIIGAVLGALAGELFERKPTLEVSSDPRNIGRTFVRGSAQSDLGAIYVGDRNNPLDGQQFADTLASLDNAIARLLNTEELGVARAALRNFDVDQFGNKQIDPEAIISYRVNTIIAAVEPQFARFLMGIEDIEARLVAFEGLRNLRTWVDSLGDAIAELDLSGDPVSAVEARIRQGNRAVDQALEGMDAAIQSLDPQAIQQAGAAAVNAVIARYRAEIQMVEQLEAALLAAQREARAVDLQLEQRIAGLTGDTSGVTATAFGNLATLRAGVESARTPEQALAFLDEFVATVDTWLQSSIAGVQQLAEAERARVSVAMEGIQAQLQGLADERAQILAGAQTRAQEQSAALRAAQEAAREEARLAEEARRAQIEALQAQMQMAQQWIAVLQQSTALLDQLTFGQANPLGGFGRLALLDERIRTTEQQFEAGSPAAASELLELLQQRLQMIQSEGLMDRPSGEYLDVYNDTLRRIGDVRARAEPEANRVLELQQQIADLQQRTVDAVVQGTDVAVQLTAQEQARLDAIADEEKALQLELLALQEELNAIAREEADAIQALKDEAVGYYRWAQTEALRIQGEQQASIDAQLQAITGGRPIDQFLADRAQETTELLTSIRDDLRGFLTAISSEFVPNPNPNATGGGWGGDRTPIDYSIQIKADIDLRGVGGDPKAMADAVNSGVQQAIRTQLPQLATQLRRELDYS